MITIHHRNQKFPMMIILSANPSKFTSLSSACHIYHWLAHKSVNFEFACFTYPFPPIHESSTGWKVSFIGDKQFTNGKISNVNSLHKSKFPCVKYYPSSLSNLANIQTEKFLVFAKSWNDTNTCALIFLKFPFVTWFSLMTRSELQFS